MFKNYLKTAYRNLLKTKVFSFINILGLAVGMTACLLILHYVHFEKSYDKFHPDYERIYRLRYERTSEDGSSVKFASCTPPAGARIRGNYPEVEKIGRILRYPASVSHQDVKFLEDRMFFVEPEFFEVLKFKFIEGDPLEDIREPNRAFVSQSTAKRYFGDQNPIGKIISMDKKMDFEITGIFEDVPQNSHLKFDILLAYPNLITLYGQDFQDAWGHTGMFTYLRVRPGTDPYAFEQKLLKLVEAECPWLEEYKMTIDLKMQPLTDIHLTSHFMQEYEANGDLASVNFLLVIAVFIILMAWVNYINLSTARALTRAKEVGLRKVVGASRFQLMAQFFFETIMINMIAVLLALVMVGLSLPFFSQVTGTPPDFSIWNQGWLWITVAIMFVAGVILSGLYPVAAMSAFKPVTVLKGKLGGSAKGINLRKALVVFQFAIALALIAGTFTVYEQISFMRSQKLGFDIEQTLVFKAPRVRDESYGEKFSTFKETLMKNADVNKICHVTEVPGRQIYWDAGAIRKAGEDISKGKNYQIVGIDYDFVDVFGLELAAGRNFSKEFPTDEMGLILNETAVNWMGFENAESAVGENVDYWGEIYTIVGVLKDYHQQSLKEVFEPHIFRLLPTGRGVRGHFAVKVNTQRIQETVAMVQQQYDAFFPGNPFDYFFLDDYYDQQYRADRLFGKVVGLFSVLAIIITALGIFGLSSFNTVQRTKEIGIRKVLGASLSRILYILNKDILILLGISFLITLPFLFVGLNTWLQGYANRMALNGWLFIVPMILVAMITLITVSYQTIKSATANPVESLRYE